MLKTNENRTRTENKIIQNIVATSKTWGSVVRGFQKSHFREIFGGASGWLESAVIDLVKVIDLNWCIFLNFSLNLKIKAMINEPLLEIIKLLI